MAALAVPSMGLHTTYKLLGIATADAAVIQLKGVSLRMLVTVTDTAVCWIGVAEFSWNYVQPSSRLSLSLFHCIPVNRLRPRVTRFDALACIVH